MKLTTALPLCGELMPDHPKTFCTRETNHAGYHHHEYSGRTWQPTPAPR